MHKLHVIGKIALTDSQRERLVQIGARYIADENPKDCADVDEIVKRIGDAGVIIDNISTPLPKSVLERCPNLKFIQTWSTGTDHIDLDYAKEKGIDVANVRNYATEAVAEQTMGVMIMMANDLIAANADARAGNWNYRRFVGIELKGKTLLTIGAGKIARRISELARAFGMKVVNTDSETPADELHEQLSKATVVSINCPLNETTRRIVGEREFRAMKGALLINYSRGGIVDEAALLQALESGNVRYAALDVFEKEPPARENPLLDHPKVFVTPHCSWNTEKAILDLTDICIENVESYLRGERVESVI